MALTRRWPATLAGATGALVAGIGGNAAESAAVSGVGWAAVAGVALSLMLHSWGLRVIGALVVLLAVLGAVLAFLSEPWFVLAFLVVALSGVVIALRGPGWASTRRRREPADDPWKRMDAGEDPTLP
ncbi:hypothetical protein [Tessaracoccus oleiagri]|uniref:Tryptophan-associated transmembrane protein (Trp_oprn_chp) n=1 Tax=Tessaracoccus oleiagri TaxID=686624 RepID=A0A1G9M1H9_9ACTN|nr:hypothetical protein [Tessaracoccus oleiagri]SDL68119.1 hypothetical protein SAMN04488242_2462 [Tessaracoccus oleiagri]